ncbi:MAG: hypothetical protein HYV63_23740 [Candidatus Schekmanbacteria bacterium]|nr:hypothetical protein [Candidatus Schekmanbacteria bacterium]
MRRRQCADRLAARIVTLGGMAIIASILAIVAVIAGEAAPLFRHATLAPAGVRRSGDGSAALAVGVDEHRRVAFRIQRSGVVFWRLSGDEAEVPAVGGIDLGGAGIVAIAMAEEGALALGLTDGRVAPASLRFSPLGVTTEVAVPLPELRLLQEPLIVDLQRYPLRMLAYAPTDR